MAGLLQSIHRIPNFPSTALFFLFFPLAMDSFFTSSSWPSSFASHANVSSLERALGVSGLVSPVLLCKVGRTQLPWLSAEAPFTSLPQPPPRHTGLLSGLWHCLQILIMALVMFSLALRVNVCLVHQTVSLLRAEVVLTISVTQNCPRADAEELSGECLNTCFPALRNVTRCLT